MGAKHYCLNLFWIRSLAGYRSCLDRRNLCFSLDLKLETGCLALSIELNDYITPIVILVVNLVAALSIVDPIHRFLHFGFRVVPPDFPNNFIQDPLLDSHHDH